MSLTFTTYGVNIGECLGLLTGTTNEAFDVDLLDALKTAIRRNKRAKSTVGLSKMESQFIGEAVWERGG